MPGLVVYPKSVTYFRRGFTDHYMRSLRNFIIKLLFFTYFIKTREHRTFCLNSPLHTLSILSLYSRLLFVFTGVWLNICFVVAIRGVEPPPYRLRYVLPLKTTWLPLNYAALGSIILPFWCLWSFKFVATRLCFFAFSLFVIFCAFSNNLDFLGSNSFIL